MLDNFINFRDNATMIWIPFGIIIGILVISFIMGFFNGWKKSLYFGVTNILFYLLSWLLYILLSDTISSSVSSWIIKNSTAGQFDANNALQPYLYNIIGLGFFSLCLFIGNVISLVLWSLVFKRIFKQSSYIKEGKFFSKFLKRGFGGLFSVAFGFIPLMYFAAPMYSIFVSNKSLEASANSPAALMYKKVIVPINNINPIKIYNSGDQISDMDSLLTFIKMATGSEFNDVVNELGNIFSGNLNNTGSMTPEEIVNNYNTIMTPEISDQISTIVNSGAGTDCIINVVNSIIGNESGEINVSYDDIQNSFNELNGHTDGINKISINESNKKQIIDDLANRITVQEGQDAKELLNQYFDIFFEVKK